MNQRNINPAYIKIGEENMNLEQFMKKVRNYDVELTRGDILSVIESAKQMNPADVPFILKTVKQAYHLNMSL